MEKPVTSTTDTFRDRNWKARPCKNDDPCANCEVGYGGGCQDPAQGGEGYKPRVDSTVATKAGIHKGRTPRVELNEIRRGLEQVAILTPDPFAKEAAEKYAARILRVMEALGWIDA